MRKISVLLGASALLASNLFACTDTFEDDCEVSGTCPSGDGDGDSSTGGMGDGDGDGDTSSGGAGDGDGDTGGTSTGGTGDGDGDATGGMGGDPNDPCNACEGDTPHCNPDDECVQCLTNSHCSEDETPVCDTEAGACVECIAAADCEDPALPMCDSNVCTAGCESTDDCERFGEDLDACDAVSGACVQCTPDTEQADCGTNSCDPATNTCTTTGRGSLDPCESCVADSECEADHFCVPLNYQAEERGGYCLKSTTGGCEQPFSIQLQNRTSLSGVTGQSYCGINESLATCEAVYALLQNQTCNGPSDCPEGSLCRTVGVLAGTRCTYECSGPAQCDEAPNPGSTCGPGTDPDPVTPDYCGGQD